MRPKKNILLVDSNEQRLAERKVLLETRGYRVFLAGDGRSALHLLLETAEGNPYYFALMITAWSLPGMSGDKLAGVAKYHVPVLPVLVCGGAGDFRSGLHGLRFANAFLPHGVSSAAELLEQVRLLTARRRGPRPSVPGFKRERLCEKAVA